MLANMISHLQIRLGETVGAELRVLIWLRWLYSSFSQQCFPPKQKQIVCKYSNNSCDASLSINLKKNKL